MDSVRQPDELKLSGNVAENWRTFRQSFELYSRAIGLSGGDEPRKIALLLFVAGRRAVELYNTFAFAEGEKHRYEAVIARFEQHCSPRANETYERYVLRNRFQEEDESIADYVTELTEKSRSCNFGTLRDSMIRDQIVIGVRDNEVRTQLLKETNLTLERAVRICQTAERARRRRRTFPAEDETLKVKEDPVWTVESRVRAPGLSPASGRRCTRCGGVGHLSEICPVRDPDPGHSDNEDEGSPVYVVTVDEDYGSSEEEWVAQLDVSSDDLRLPGDRGVPVRVPVRGLEDPRRPEHAPKDRPILIQSPNAKQTMTPMGVVKQEVEFESTGVSLTLGRPVYPVNSSLQQRKRKRNNQLFQDQPYVKKPPNAFMIYMKQHRPHVVSELVWSDNALVNRILGQRWKSLSSSEQSKYYEEAEEAKKVHAEKYPWWSARENYGKKKKRIRRKNFSGTEEDYEASLGFEPNTCNNNSSSSSSSSISSSRAVTSLPLTSDL